MTTPSAAAAGTITIGGDLAIHRLGDRAMRLTAVRVTAEDAAGIERVGKKAAMLRAAGP